MNTHLYNPDYLRETQKLLENMKRDSYSPLLSRSGKIADIGCGVGADVNNMAQLGHKDCKFVGVDADQGMIDQANLNKGERGNVEFLVGNANALPFAGGELSGLRAERLAQHLANPAQVFDEFHRVLKDGSPVVIVETDWNSVSFYNGDNQTVQRLREYLVAHQVKNGGAATNLIHYLETAGFTHVSIRLYPLATHILEQCIATLRIDYALTMMEQNGYITQEAHRTFLNTLRQADSSGCFVCSINLVVVTALK
ncbi:methyltransferase domain-containing protein [Parapedobacter sp. 10938]|uniref:methyltransferase domain-containing protein n=1 Tax=Parapedobacter flavus TaxID=3110225 RepID=UPI002DC03D5D|nr:methyltransferase domain-containing protein [Parapedobacter sp. 10938]MEC3879555.1 methyltransferase domain-containing protein [Parapedobacter sp. 10938]